MIPDYEMPHDTLVRIMDCWDGILEIAEIAYQLGREDEWNRQAPEVPRHEVRDMIMEGA